MFLESPLPSEIRWISRQLKPFLPLLVANLALMVVGSSFTLVGPIVVKWLVDVALPKRDLRLVMIATVAFCTAYLASVGMNYLTTFISDLVTQKLVFRTRVSLVRHIHTLSSRYHGNAKIGETLHRIEQDVDRVSELSGDILPLTIQMVIMGVLVLTTMSMLNWHLTALTIPLLPVFYILQRRYSRRLKTAADDVQKHSGMANAFLQEHLAGMRQLQLLNRTSAQGMRFARLAAERARSNLQQRTMEIFFGAASVSIIVLGVGLSLGYGGREVIQGRLTVGGLVAFYGYVFRLFAPVSLAIDLQSRFQRAGASIRRILEVSQQRSDGRPGTRSLGSYIRPELEFRSIWFSYNQDRPVLQDMSFRVEPGETVAVVGLNGSGKSTIGLLATRLYDPDSGSILLGGQDIQDFGRRSLRAALTLVPQDPVLFDETVRGNLLYGNPNATRSELDKVAALTQLDSILKKLLGPLGGRLSGGEKKRLALARALLQKPRILILDEITSALDAPAAAGLLAGLDLFRHTRTLVVISHRPGTILWADRILVVDQGTIVDSGKHADLILKCKPYRRIWQSQDSNQSANAEPQTWSENATQGMTVECLGQGKANGDYEQLDPDAIARKLNYTGETQR